MPHRVAGTTNGLKVLTHKRPTISGADEALEVNSEFEVNETHRYVLWVAVRVENQVGVLIFSGTRAIGVERI